jgi:hypothetical protein
VSGELKARLVNCKVSGDESKRSPTPSNGTARQQTPYCGYIRGFHKALQIVLNRKLFLAMAAGTHIIINRMYMHLLVKSSSPSSVTTSASHLVL